MSGREGNSLAIDRLASRQQQAILDYVYAEPVLRLFSRIGSRWLIQRHAACGQKPSIELADRRSLECEIVH